LIFLKYVIGGKPFLFLTRLPIEKTSPPISRNAPANRLQIIDCLKMRQPNHHNPAHDILQKISGQKYGDRDYEAWQRWLDTVRKVPVME